MVEAVPGRQELRLVAEVPLADAHRGVALLLAASSATVCSLALRPMGHAGKMTLGSDTRLA